MLLLLAFLPDFRSRERDFRERVADVERRFLVSTLLLRLDDDDDVLTVAGLSFLRLSLASLRSRSAWAFFSAEVPLPELLDEGPDGRFSFLQAAIC